MIFLTGKVIGELVGTRAQSCPLLAPQGQAGFSRKSCLVWVGTKSPQSCLTLCDPMDGRLPDSIHGIFQAGMLEWIAMSFSRGSSQPRDQTYISCIFCIGKRILYH